MHCVCDIIRISSSILGDFQLQIALYVAVLGAKIVGEGMIIYIDFNTIL